MSEQQQRTNTSGKLFSSYVAAITNVEHPDGLYMAQVRLLGLWDVLPIDALPWAEFVLPLGAKSESGHAIPVEVGDQVWVDFPRRGDTRYPRITGAVYQAPDMVSNLPTEITGEGFEQKRAEGEPVPPTYSAKDDIYKRFGLMEQKTHEGGYCMTHIATGTAFEITKAGQVVIHAESDAFRSSKTLLEQVTGAVTIKVGGNALIDAKGDVTAKAGGNATIDAKGKGTLKAGGDCSVEGANLKFKSKGNADFDIGGIFGVKAKMANFKLG